MCSHRATGQAIAAPLERLSDRRATWMDPPSSASPIASSLPIRPAAAAGLPPRPVQAYGASSSSRPRPSESTRSHAPDSRSPLSASGSRYPSPGSAAPCELAIVTDRAHTPASAWPTDADSRRLQSPALPFKRALATRRQLQTRSTALARPWQAPACRQDHDGMVQLSMGSTSLQ